MNNELYLFVKESLEKGIARSEIRDVLLRAGWEEGEAEKALASFANVPFSIPVPRKRPYLEAREAFLSLISFLALYISAFSFGALLFNFVDAWFYDPVQQMFRDPFSSGLRMAIASLIVAFPLYLFVMRILKQGAVKDPERRESRVRRWLTYLTLVVAAAILLGDFIAIVFNLLGGELTIRFILKTLVVFLITGSIFGYYLSDLQKEEKEK